MQGSTGKEAIPSPDPNKTNTKPSPWCCTNSQGSSEGARACWKLAIQCSKNCTATQYEIQRPNAHPVVPAEAGIAFMLKKKGGDFWKLLTFERQHFKFTMPCFDISLLIQTVIYAAAQGWMKWQNKTPQVSQISVFLGDFKMFNTALLSSTLSYITPRNTIHSRGHTAPTQTPF